MSLVFNIFVIYTLFNQINARVLDDSFNIFVRIHKNFWFPLITLVELALQIIIIEFGNAAFKVVESGLTARQWGITIGFSAVTFVLSIIIKLIPLDKCIDNILNKSKEEDQQDDKATNEIEMHSVKENSTQKLVQKNDINIYSNPNIQKDEDKQKKQDQVIDVKNEDKKIKKEGSSSLHRSLKRNGTLGGGSLRSKKADVNPQ